MLLWLLIKDAGYFCINILTPHHLSSQLYAAEKVNSLTGTGPYILFHGNLEYLKIMPPLAH